jgi:hypothetical protein
MLVNCKTATIHYQISHATGTSSQNCGPFLPDAYSVWGSSCSFGSRHWDTRMLAVASLRPDLSADEMLRRGVLLLVAVLLAVARPPHAYASEADHKVRAPQRPLLSTLDPNAPWLDPSGRRHRTCAWRAGGSLPSDGSCVLSTRWRIWFVAVTRRARRVMSELMVWGLFQKLSVLISVPVGARDEIVTVAFKQKFIFGCMQLSNSATLS